MILCRRLGFFGVFVLPIMLISLVGLVGFSGCKDTVPVSSEWVDKGMVVDGKADDWQGIGTRYFEEQGAVVGIANDAERLYLIVKFRDPKWVGLIKMTGLKLEFQTNLSYNNPYVLKYRGGPTPEEMQKLRGKSPGSNSDRDFGGMRPGGTMGGPSGDQRVFTCAVKDRIDEKAIPIDGTEGPTVAYSLDQGLFSYEFSIPIDEGGVRFYGLGISPGDETKLGVSWGDMGEMTRSRPTPDDMSSSMPSGGGKGGGGGRGGGGRGGGMGGQRPEMPQKQEVWFRIDLSEGPSEGNVSEE